MGLLMIALKVLLTEKPSLSSSRGKKVNVLLLKNTTRGCDCYGRTKTGNFKYLHTQCDQRSVYQTTIVNPSTIRISAESRNSECDKRRKPASVKLYPYQEDAIANWLKAGQKGIFEMATGTGKTITALSCAVNRYMILADLP